MVRRIIGSGLLCSWLKIGSTVRFQAILQAGFADLEDLQASDLVSRLRLLSASAI